MNEIYHDAVFTCSCNLESLTLSYSIGGFLVVYLLTYMFTCLHTYCVINAYCHTCSLTRPVYYFHYLQFTNANNESYYPIMVAALSRIDAISVPIDNEEINLPTDPHGLCTHVTQMGAPLNDQDNPPSLASTSDEVSTSVDHLLYNLICKFGCIRIFMLSKSVFDIPRDYFILCRIT